MTTTQRRILRITEVCHVVGLSRSGVYAMIKGGTFPKPIKLGFSSGWIESEVQAWIESKIQASLAA